MKIVVNLDAVLHARGIRAKEVAAAIGVSETHLSQFRSGKVKGVRFETLAKICAFLDCRPGDLLDCDPRPDSSSAVGTADQPRHQASGTT